MTTQKHWLVVGLGNPGDRYALTRHNLGARVVETIRDALGQPPFRMQRALHARVSRGTAILVIPTTLMNESGLAVAALVRHFRIPPDLFVVVHDEKDLAFGQIKLQRDRGSAGHRGVQSIIDALGLKNFWRLRVGIGAPPVGAETDVFVLQPFSRAEEHAITSNVVPEAVARILGHTS